MVASCVLCSFFAVGEVLWRKVVVRLVRGGF